MISAVSVSGIKKIVESSNNLPNYQQFRDLGNLKGIDVLATRLWFDRKVNIPLASNACFGFDPTTGWTFFDLNALQDEYQTEPGTVIEADFYHANQLLPMSDNRIIAKVQRDLTNCIPSFANAKVIDSSVIRVKKGVTHFFPGSYQYLLPAKTEIPNLFMSGDWIVTRHGSWSQEKAYVTGLEAANLVIDRFGMGNKANIIPIEPDEPHIQLARDLNRSIRNFSKLLPDFWLP